MDNKLWCEEIEGVVRRRCVAVMQTQPLGWVLQIDQVERWVLEAIGPMLSCAQDVWSDTVEQAAVHVARECPGCGRLRKCRRRADEPMTVDGVDGKLNVGKAYMTCDTPDCSAPGLSVMKVLTDISSGDSTLTTQLMAARQASQESYGKASQTLRESPWETDIERTKLRRMALAVESEAKEFAEEQRRSALEGAATAQVPAGPELLVLEGDGGMVRTGRLRPTVPGDPKHGEKTAARELPRRRREVTFREVATIDVRRPGEVEPRAVDAVVSVLAPEGEKARRMRALAIRGGMGSETEMYGLGDMGSGLHTAFDQAFAGRAAFWEADQTHTKGYVRAASEVLASDAASAATQPGTRASGEGSEPLPMSAATSGTIDSAAAPDGPPATAEALAVPLSMPAATSAVTDSAAAPERPPATGEALTAPACEPSPPGTFSPESWKAKMWSAIYARDAERCDILLETARSHRDPSKTPTPKLRRLRSSDKCPIEALDSYLTNHWDHLRFAEMKERRLPVVSARGECQVRVRTGDRFGGPPSWKVENIEGKATLRAIVFDGRYPTFVQWCWDRRDARFVNELHTRLDQAVASKRLTPGAAALLRSPNTTLADLLRYQLPLQVARPRATEAVAA